MSSWSIPARRSPRRRCSGPARKLRPARTLAAGPLDGGGARYALALAGLLAKRSNDLTAAAIGLLPAIADVLAALEQQPPCLLARLSGSGATCFGLFAERGEAREAAAAIAAAHPDWWVVATMLTAAPPEIAVVPAPSSCAVWRRCLWWRPPAAVGASPSGKAADFDSAIPRFESWRPSQFPQVHDFP